jgi:glycosyltransferase involved in cell wall biosynthesis
MKILIAVTNSFCANFIKGQARFLKEQGHEVVIVSAYGEEIKKLIDEELPIYYRVPFVKDISFLQDLKCLFLIYQIIKKERPDIINAGNPKPGFLFSLVSILFPNIPFIFTLRGLRSDTLIGFKRSIVFLTERITCYLANKVIVISPSLLIHATNLKVLKMNKSVVLGYGSSNGVDVKKFVLDHTNKEKGISFRKKHDIDKDTIVFVFVGRINIDKGIVELFNAFEMIKFSGKNVKLIIAGPLERDDAIPDAIFYKIIKNKDVVLLGKVNDVVEVYAASDVLVLYSHREGFGNVVIEASSMGLATIVADIPGLKDTTEHMKSGIIVKPNSVDSLVKAMLFYIEQPCYIKHHGDYGKDRILKHFTFNIIHLGQLKIYEELFDKK